MIASSLDFAPATKTVSRLALIAPDEAERMLAEMQYPHQRPIDKGHVSRLAADMTAERFFSGTPLHIAYTPTQRYLLDGQHRLSAVVKAQRAIAFTVIEHTVSTLDSLAWMYGKTDTGKRRTAADLYRPLGLAEETGLTSSDINVLSAALDLLGENRFRRSAKERQLNAVNRVSLLRSYAPAMRELNTLRHGIDPAIWRSMNRSYAIAVAIVTLRYGTPGLEKDGITPTPQDFWRGALTNEAKGLDPRALVVRHFDSTRMRIDKQTGTTSIAVAEGARILVALYNRYMRHETIKAMPRISDVNYDNPVKIEGIDPALDWTS
jgi:hypothetical protein